MTKKIALALLDSQEYNYLSLLIFSATDFKVVWNEPNIKNILSRIQANKPDLLLLPACHCDGEVLETIKAVMEQALCPIMLVGNANAGNISQGTIFKASGFGVLSYAEYDMELTTSPKNADLIEKIKIDLGDKKEVRKTSTTGTISRVMTQNLGRTVLIGSSSGGPAALKIIIDKMPRLTDCVVIIAQHIGDGYTAGLAEWLARNTENKIIIPEHGEKLIQGNVYLAKGGQHIYFNANNTVSYKKELGNYPYKPSINHFFESITDNLRSKGLAMILTGMGRDGAEGLLKLKQKGWKTIVQDKETSAIYGMPKAAKEIGAGDEILAIEEIARRVADYVHPRK